MIRLVSDLARALRVAEAARAEHGVTIYVIRGIYYRTSPRPPANERDLVAVYPAHGYRRPHARYR